MRIYVTFSLSLPKFINCLIFVLCISGLIFGADWSYEGNSGPKNWKGKCKFGTRQSPINFIVSRTKQTKGDKKLVFSKQYYRPQKFEIVNDGHTIKLIQPQSADGTWKPSQLSVEGAGWKGKYAFLQMHFHWKSEHLIKGKRYPLELHIVHEQVNGKGGLGVLGIIYGDSNKESKVLKPIIDMLPQVAQPSETPVPVTASINLSSLLPNTWDIFRYTGSLTTPPCAENILWSVFTQRMPISKTQVQQFYKMFDTNGKPILKNYRPVQPIVTKTRKNIFWMPVKKGKMVSSAFS